MEPTYTNPVMQLEMNCILVECKMELTPQEIAALAGSYDQLPENAENDDNSSQSSSDDETPKNGDKGKGDEGEEGEEVTPDDGNEVDTYDLWKDQKEQKQPLGYNFLNDIYDDWLGGYKPSGPEEAELFGDLVESKSEEVQNEEVQNEEVQPPKDVF